MQWVGSGPRHDIGAKVQPAFGLCKGAKVRAKYQVTGDGHRGIGLSGVGRSAFGSRLRISRLMAEQPIPELPTTVPVTRHLKLVSPLHFCTGALLRFAPLHCL